MIGTLRRARPLVPVLFALACGCAKTLPLAVPPHTGLGQACAANGTPDRDGDGLADACEDAIAERFAPIVHHADDEPNLPTDVDTLLASSALSFFDDACSPDMVVEVKRSPSQKDLIARSMKGGCGPEVDVVTSAGSRSTNKQRTFFLTDVPVPVRKGSPARAWTTYAHVYASEAGGVTIQYWRLHAFNDGQAQHGGDWEGLHVVLDANQEPVFVRLLGHASIEELPWKELETEGTHVKVWSELGGHATRANGPPGAVVRHETWNGGKAVWPDGRVEPGGRLVNVGEKKSPLHDQLFIEYSGLWGSPGLLYVTSGYWGPAFNETSMQGSYVTAWCMGMTGARAEAECAPLGITR